MLVEVLNTSQCKLHFIRQTPAIFCLILEEIVSTKPIHSFLSLNLEDYRCCQKNLQYSNFSEQFPSFYDVTQFNNRIIFCVSSNSFKKSLFFPELHHCSYLQKLCRVEHGQN